MVYHFKISYFKFQFLVDLTSPKISIFLPARGEPVVVRVWREDWM